MRLHPALSFITPALLVACGGGSVGPEAPGPRAATEAEIGSEDLRRRIEVFADDSMGGRRTGSPGNVKGNAYIASNQSCPGDLASGINPGWVDVESSEEINSATSDPT